MSDLLFTPESCGGCRADGANASDATLNVEGLNAIRNRLGTHSAFKAGMLAALTAVSDEYNPLRALKNRDDDDPTIALVDAWAVVLDILSFYQERIANEGYLRTAVERLSILELARAVGYVPSPGVAATTHVAFLLENAKTVPTIISVPPGTQLQSIPGPEEKPQVFETLDELEARRAWNEMTPRMSVPLLPGPNTTWVYLLGTSLNLQSGDQLLFVSGDRLDNSQSDNWKLRSLQNVVVDRDHNRTKVEWLGEFDGAAIFGDYPSEAKIYVLRQKAAIFGYNAPSWKALSVPVKMDYLGCKSEEFCTIGDEWPNYTVYARSNDASKSPLNVETVFVTPDVMQASERIQLKALQAAMKSGQDTAAAGAKSVLLTAQSLTAGLTFVTKAGQAVVDLLDKFVRTGLNSSINALNAQVTAFTELAASSFDYRRPVASLSALVTQADRARDTARNALQSTIDSTSAALRALPEVSIPAEDLAAVVKTFETAARSSFDTMKQVTAAAGATDCAAAAAGTAKLFTLPIPKGTPELTYVDLKNAVLSVLETYGNDAPASATVAHAALISPYAGAVAVAALATGVDFVPLTIWKEGSQLTKQVILDEFAAIEREAWKKIKTRYQTPPADPTAIDLDRVYTRITQATWAVLSKPGRTELFAVTDVHESGRDEFMLSGKVTRLKLDGPKLSDFEKDVRTTAVYAQSEELTLAEFPLLWTDVQSELPLPVMNDRLDVDHFLAGSGEPRKIIVTGKRLRAKLPPNETLTVTAAPGLVFTVQAEESVRLLEVPTPVDEVKTIFHLETDNGLAGFVTVEQDPFIYTPSFESDETVAEVAVLRQLTSIGGQPAILYLQKSLRNIYDRATVKVYGNVALASHGETHRAVLGSGNGAQSFQSFSLPDKPLTHIPSSNPSGSESTLKLRVNDILWTQIRSLNHAGLKDQVFVVSEAEDGKATIQFGDGKSGTRLPTGVENVSANYRAGIGLAGHVRAGQLSLLMKAPLGVKSVVGPLPAAGAADPEPRDQMRQNAPVSILAMGRVVSLSDFENFARAFSGIGKARAEWLPHQGRRLVHVTVASQDGSEFGDDSYTLANLKLAIRQASNGMQSFVVSPYRLRQFALRAKVRVDARYLAEKVFKAVAAALADRFSFAHRQFGQKASKSEVIACIQAVEGVVAVDLETLHIAGATADLNAILPADGAIWDNNGIHSAELLTVDPRQIRLTVMQL